MALTPLPDRVTIYHTRAAGQSPENWAVAATGLRASITVLSDDRALAATAAGERQVLITHRARLEPHAACVVDALLRRHSDDKCWFVQGVTESNRRDGAGRPDHLLVKLSVVDPPPELPDAATARRRDR